MAGEVGWVCPEVLDTDAVAQLRSQALQLPLPWVFDWSHLQRVEPEAASTETEVGDTDPVQAIEDALRTFPADEVLVVTRPDDDASWLEQDSAEEARERFGVPLTRLTV